MEEKELFGEIKPLIEEYKEYANKETPEVFKWNDARASSVSKVQDRNYATDREREILEILDEERAINSRKELIEELVQIREAKKQEMRSTIFEKVWAFINDTREKMNKEIEEKRQELEKQKEEKREELKEKLENKQQELKEKEQLRSEVHKKCRAYQDESIKIKGNKILEEGYTFFEAKSKEFNNNLYTLNKDVKALEKECEALKFEYEDFSIENDEGLQELVNRLNEFDNTYGNIDFESEDAIEYIGEMVESYKEEDEIHKLTEDEVEVEEPEKVVTMEDIENDEQVKQQDEKFEEKSEEQPKEVEQNQQPVEKKPTEAKQKTTTEKQTKAQTKAGAQKPTGANPKPTETKQSCKETLRVGISKGEEEQVEVKVQAEDMDSVFDMQEKQILIEELEQRLAELKAGFEDIVEVDGNYIALENNLRSYESVEDIEWVLQHLEGKNILDIYEGMLAQEEIPKEIEYLKNIIKQLEERAEKLDLEKLVNEIGEPLQEEINPEELETPEYDPDIEIRYRADKDKYSIINKDTNERDITEYNKISPMTIEQIVEKYELYDSFEEGIDPAIVAILEKFDEKNGTNKTEKYLKAVTKMAESKEDRQEDMEYAKIAIKYNLIGLYDKKYRFSKEERNSILELASRAERNGIATVKKGVKARILSVFEKVTNKLFSKKVALGNGKSKQKKEEMDGYMKSMNNAAKSITSKNSLQQQIHVEVNEQQAIKAVEAKAELEPPEVEQEKA